MSSGKSVVIIVEVFEKGIPTNVKVDVSIKNVSRSRSFKIRMLDKRSAVLTKPKYTSFKEAVVFLESCKSWISKQIEVLCENISLSAFLLDSPKIYAPKLIERIDIIQSRTSPFFIFDESSSKLVFAVRQENRDIDLQNMFLQFAEQRLSKLAQEESVRTGLYFSKLTVRNQSSRWASRSCSGVISLNWRIMLLKSEFQRYIVCHELAHTQFMDHSVSFWISLNRIFPNAQKIDKEVSKLAKQIFNIVISK